MKRILTIVALASVLAAPSFAKDKAPKNEKVNKVIFLIGDGMGLPAVATYMYDQNLEQTAFDRAQFTGFSKTYSANSRVTDSAAGGTALATGYKTGNGMLGMTLDQTPVNSVAYYAKQEGKSVGIICTSNVCDATPGAFYAHTPSRGNGGDIAQSIIDARYDVVMGGGMDFFTVNKDQDGTVLYDKAKAAGFNFLETPEEFYKTTSTDSPVLGLFAGGNYPMVIDRDSDFLADALNHTLDLFENNKKGFFIMVEGSHIDHAAHANNTEQLIFEMEEFNKVVNAAMDYADTHKGTLVVVAADHETGGLAIVGGSKDFHLADTGIGVKYATSGHTACPIVVYSYGASAWQFSGFMENTEVGKKIGRLLVKNKEAFK